MTRANTFLPCLQCMLRIERGVSPAEDGYGGGEESINILPLFCLMFMEQTEMW